MTNAQQNKLHNDNDLQRIQQILDRATLVQIVAGEAELGTIKDYTSTRTVRALKSRLTRERCGGDRWAKAHVYADDYCYIFDGVKIS